jgi:uncharacterized protein (DUF433 family)
MVKTASPPDPRTLAAYTYAQASRLLDIPASTIRAWKKGYHYTYRGERKLFEGPIPSHLTRGLSYFDLVEIFVLRSLRVEHEYPLRYIREALDTAWNEFGIDHLFLHAEFRHSGKEFFLDQYTHLASLSPGKQIALKGVLEGYLQRIGGYGSDRLARYFYPIPPNRGIDSPQIIVINPHKSFGRPMIERVGIRTDAIYDRINAGEDPEHVRLDYGLEPEELVEAINFEAA